MLDTDTKRRIDTCRDILVGKVPDPKSQVEQITIALIYKFMDDMDAEAEELGGERRFFKGDNAKYGWSKLMAPGMGGFDMLGLYSEAIQKMNENSAIPELFRDIFKNAYLPYRDPETLRSFLKEIDGFKYDHSERLGDAFEYLLSVLGSQGDAGQFRTPRHIIDFMVEIIDPQKNEVILDPACGTAGFLISSYKHILKHNSKGYQSKADREAYDEKGVPLESLTLESPMRYKGDLLTPDERKRIAKSIKGYDISPDMVRLSLVNMYLHGFAEPDIEEYDTLTSEERWNEHADIILANPPFMSPKGGIKPHKRFSIQASRSEVLFVDYIAEHLTPTGRAAVIVPEGIIFQSGGAYKQLREMLVKQSLVAVISLPAGVFNPYSGVKTSILVMDRRIAKKTDSILFVKIENDGFNLGAQRRPIDKNDLPDIVRNIKAWADAVRNDKPFDEARFPNLLLVKKERLAEGGEFNLSGERYKEQTVRFSKYDLVPIGEVCDLINGRAFKPEDWEKESDGGLPIIRIQNLNNSDAPFNYYSGEFAEKNLVKNGDLLFSWSGSRGTSFGAHIWNGTDAILNQHIFNVKFDEDRLIKKYLYYALNQAVSEVEENLHGGVGLVHITKGNLEKIKIPIPPIEVQKEIVTEVESYQKIIDGARQIVESYQPRIPLKPDWPIVELGELCKPEYGFTASAEEKGSHRFVRITDIGADGHLKMEDAKYINITDEAKKSVLSVGDLLVARTGATYGKTMIFKEKMPAVFASYLIRLRFPEDKVDPNYYWAFAQSENYWSQAKALVTGGGQPQFNGNAIISVKIPLPDIDTQRAIVAEIENELKLVNSNKELISIFEEKIKATINRVWGTTE